MEFKPVPKELLNKTNLTKIELEHQLVKERIKEVSNKNNFTI